MTHRKLVVLWLPIAGLQAATLAGLGYFYHRLDDLEHKAEAVSAVATPELATAMPAPVSAAPTVISPQPVLVTPLASQPAASSVMVTPQQPVIVTTLTSPSLVKDVPEVVDAKVSSGALAKMSSPLPKSPEVIAPVKPDKSESTSVKREVKPVTVKRTDKRESEPVKRAAERTAVANRSGVVVRQLTNVTTRQDIEPLPVQVDKVWVYLGELRDYGWHDQKLHIPPSSGLPAIGRVYLTQYIARVHASPYGRQLAGKFHLGERILLHEVRRGQKDDVWGLVSAQ
ncbi:hypothetical protein [Candidatus Thiothrix anitrata]|uniref:SH3 domain-containing protein n=1 Tax=Candidatus Thiothrix anitrata TaxID=2823902 RepID=A0ABX7X3Z4_9GAMM|nr:hypothetical protein [Candidatus Thiothrix anitrata]QTR50127.1 hypothetical protein J8380_00645 [Candidatus Thiothrix anitrata]